MVFIGIQDYFILINKITPLTSNPLIVPSFSFLCEIKINYLRIILIKLTRRT